MPNKAKAQPAAPSEDALRTRAYLLWEADGRPEGMADHYWIKAHELDQAVQADVHKTAEKTAMAMKAGKGPKADKSPKPPKAQTVKAQSVKTEPVKAETAKAKSVKTKVVEPAKARLKAAASKVAALAVKAKPAAKAPKKL